MDGGCSFGLVVNSLDAEFIMKMDDIERSKIETVQEI